MCYSFCNLFRRALNSPRAAPQRAHQRPRLRLVLEELEVRVTPSVQVPLHQTVPTVPQGTQVPEEQV